MVRRKNSLTLSDKLRSRDEIFPIDMDALPARFVACRRSRHPHRVLQCRVAARHDPRPADRRRRLHAARRPAMERRALPAQNRTHRPGDRRTGRRPVVADRNRERERPQGPDARNFLRLQLHSPAHVRQARYGHRAAVPRKSVFPRARPSDRRAGTSPRAARRRRTARRRTADADRRPPALATEPRFGRSERSGKPSIRSCAAIPTANCW